MSNLILVFFCFLLVCVWVFQCFCCDICVFIVLNRYVSKLGAYFFFVFLFFIVLFFESIFYILTKALAEVEVDQRVHGGMVDTED